MLEKDRVQILLDAGAEFAELMLKEHGEFHPFGWAMNSSGEPISVSIDMGEEFSVAKDIISAYLSTFKDEGASGNFIATAIFYDVRVVLPNSEIKSDAVATLLDDINGYSRIVTRPYRFEEGQLIFSDLFASTGNHEIFGKPS